jgi:centrosomal protein CEP76
VPDGHTFKAFPAQFTSTDTEAMMVTFNRTAASADILETRGDTVRFAIRVKMVPYPEERCAVWVMLAVRYRAIF